MNRAQEWMDAPAPQTIRTICDELKFSQPQPFSWTVTTLPPSGLQPTLPPAPHERARRAAGYAAAGLLLLVGALISLSLAHAEDARLFAYDNDTASALLSARIAFGFSLAAQIAALWDVSVTWKWRQERTTTGMALLMTTAWMATVLWLITVSH